VSQSPSLRGSGRFIPSSRSSRRRGTSQSPSLRGSGRFWTPPLSAAWRTGVSIPFIAGQWSLPFERRFPLWTPRGVSIPFIAGQWSLPERGRRLQNQLEVSIPFIAGQWSLLSATADEAVREQLVSIPFIAGQWSLHQAPSAHPRERTRSQSPSLRGSGRFKRALPALDPDRGRLNPLHCGAVVASRRFGLSG